MSLGQGLNCFDICRDVSQNCYVNLLLSTHADRHVVDISFTVCLFVFFFVRRIFVTDISDVGWRRAMKFCRMVDLGVQQVVSPFGELWSRG